MHIRLLYIAMFLPNNSTNLIYLMLQVDNIPTRFSKTAILWCFHFSAVLNSVQLLRFSGKIINMRSKKKSRFLNLGKEYKAILQGIYRLWA